MNSSKIKANPYVEYKNTIYSLNILYSLYLLPKYSIKSKSKNIAAKANNEIKQVFMFMLPEDNDSDIFGVITIDHSKNIKVSGKVAKPFRYIK